MPFVNRSFLEGLLWRLDNMEASIRRLQEAVRQNTSATASAAEMLRGVAEQMRDAKDDPEQIEALATEIEANTQKLAEAQTAGTVAEGDATGTGEDTFSPSGN